MKEHRLIRTPSRRYARALMDVAIKLRSFTIVLEELELFERQLDATPLLRQLFMNPAVPFHQKEKVLVDLASRLKLQALTQNFLKTLIRRARLALLKEITVSAEQQFLEKQGIVVVEVMTARKLDPQEENALVARLEQFTGKKVQLESSVDSSLVGGAVTRIGTTLYDGSVVTHLEQIRQKIMQS
jgi:F-type H+-transporting ATPase subunit delta